MKPACFPIVYAAVAHSNKVTIAKLRIKKVFISIRLLDNPINDAILTKAFSFPRAFLHISEIWSFKFSFQSN